MVRGKLAREAELGQTGTMTGSGNRLPDAILYGGVSACLVLLIVVSRGDIGLIRGCEILLGGTLLIGTLLPSCG
jgi:hypothetical protein